MNYLLIDKPDFVNCKTLSAVCYVVRISAARVAHKCRASVPGDGRVCGHSSRHTQGHSEGHLHEPLLPGDANNLVLFIKFKYSYSL